jgi:hypothetical protein
MRLEHQLGIAVQTPARATPFPRRIHASSVLGHSRPASEPTTNPVRPEHEQRKREAQQVLNCVLLAEQLVFAFRVHLAVKTGHCVDAIEFVLVRFPAGYQAVTVCWQDAGHGSVFLRGSTGRIVRRSDLICQLLSEGVARHPSGFLGAYQPRSNASV